MIKKRPLSPHILIYRWEWSMIYSITQRIFGIILGIGLIFLIFLFSIASYYSTLFKEIFNYLTNPLSLIIWVPYSFMLFFFICGSIRHILWDFIIGIELSVASKTGHVALLVSLLLTIFFWYGIFHG